MLNAPRPSEEAKAHFKTLRDFKVSDLEWLLSEEKFRRAGLNRLLEDEPRILYLLIIVSIFFSFLIGNLTVGMKPEDVEAIRKTLA